MTPAPLLDRLHQALGVDPAEPRGDDQPPPLRLDADGDLTSIAEAAVAARLEAEIAAPRTAAARATAVAAACRALAGLDGPVLLTADPGRLVVDALAALGAAEGADDVPRWTAAGGDQGAIDVRDPAAREAALANLDSGSVVIVEPRAAAADLVTLRAAIDAAHERGARIVVDERRTAARLAAGAVSAGWPVDVVVFGPSVAAGRPFGAAVFRAAPPQPDAADGGAPDAVTLAVVDAVLATLAAEPRHPAAAAAGAALIARLRAAARAHDLQLDIDGPDALPALVFAGQENAEAPLIAHHFQLELLGAGCRAEAVLRPPPASVTALEPFAAAFEFALARIRTLLIEHNSWLSGGVPFVFPDNPAALAARGIACYRYPKLGPVDIEPTPDGTGMRIAFAAGELGPITSSGFYLPTRLAGDLEIVVRYTIQRWEPGPDSACLGLFLQNEPSTRRYYAQLMSTADRPDERSVAAGLEGGLGRREVVDGASGWLRLTRAGTTVRAFHRPSADDDWQLLGELDAGVSEPVIAGAKIWSKVRCGGLVADLTELRVTAEIPAEQLPELEPRPDPRG